MYLPLVAGLTFLLSVVADTATTQASPDSADNSQGYCSNPTVRKEWRSLSTSQRAAWTKAVLCLANTPHTSSFKPYKFPSDNPPPTSTSSLYDDLVYLHMDNNHDIHYTGLFLPFHRWFVSTFEGLMRSKCGYTGPMAYWDWTKDASNPIASTMFNADQSSGLGTLGKDVDDFTVHDGAFGSNVGKFKLAYPSPHFLRRNFSNTPWDRFPAGYLVDNVKLNGGAVTDSKSVNYLVNNFVGDFLGMQTYLDRVQGMHSGPHLMMGADLQGTCPRSAGPQCISGQAWSVNDPMFFLHHGMIDKVWSDWQRANWRNQYAFGGGSVQALGSRADFNKYPVGAPPNLNTNTAIPDEGMGRPAKINDVLSTTGGFLCYVYQ